MAKFALILGILSIAFTHSARAEEDPWGRVTETPTPKATVEKKPAKKKKASRAPASYRPKAVVPVQKPEAPVSTDTAPSGEDTWGLSGSWGGVRKKIEEHGIGIAAVYKGDWARNFSGGNSKESGYIDNFDLKVSLDAEKAFGAKGLSFLAYGLGNSGVKRGVLQSNTTGAIQGIDNIEVTSDDFKLYELWAQYAIEDLHLSILFGLHDLNSEFYVTDSSTLFLNPAYGIGTSLAQTGTAGPSIFPYTAPALRLRVDPTKRFYFQNGIFNGPNENMATNGSHFLIQPNSGYLMIQEAGFTGTESNPWKLAFGYWNWTNTSNSGAYALGDWSITPSFSIFTRFGIASKDSNPTNSSLESGFLIKGLIPHRPDDRFGLGISRVTPSDSTLMNETIFESTYRIELMKGVALQPDLQYVVHPGLSDATSNALASQLRVELSL